MPEIAEKLEIPESAEIGASLTISDGATTDAVPVGDSRPPATRPAAGCPSPSVRERCVELVGWNDARVPSDGMRTGSGGMSGVGGAPVGGAGRMVRPPAIAEKDDGAVARPIGVRGSTLALRWRSATDRGPRQALPDMCTSS
eukprot:scaffold303448_cov35-Tisochrysis_lutea.AAC.3